MEEFTIRSEGKEIVFGISGNELSEEVRGQYNIRLIFGIS